MGYYSDNYNETVKSVLGELDKALGAVEPETVEKFVQAVLEADQVYFVGVGRVLLSLQAICKRLAHLGIKTTMWERSPSRLSPIRIFWL